MKRDGRILLAWMMMLLLVLNLFPVQTAVFAREEGADVSELLTNPAVIVSQGGEPIEAGGTLDSTAPITVELSFGIPVEGDHPTPDQPVRKGDHAMIELSDAFSLENSYTGERRHPHRARYSGKGSRNGDGNCPHHLRRYG